MFLARLVDRQSVRRQKDIEWARCRRALGAGAARQFPEQRSPVAQHLANMNSCAQASLLKGISTRCSRGLSMEYGASLTRGLGHLVKDPTVGLL